MTSRDVTFSTTGRLSGTWISFAVCIRCEGTASSYSISHHHWWPMTLMVTALEACSDVMVRPVHTLETRRPSSMTTVRATAVVTLPVTAGGSARASAGSSLRRPRTTDIPTNAIVITYTAAVTHNISSQRAWMEEDWIPAGARTD